MAVLAEQLQDGALAEAILRGKSCCRRASLIVGCHGCDRCLVEPSGDRVNARPGTVGDPTSGRAPYRGRCGKFRVSPQQLQADTGDLSKSPWYYSPAHRTSPDPAHRLEGVGLLCLLETSVKGRFESCPKRSAECDTNLHNPLLSRSERSRPLEHVPDVARITAEPSGDLHLLHTSLVEANHLGHLGRCHPGVSDLDAMLPEQTYDGAAR
jgi:hypothetical protein